MHLCCVHFQNYTAGESVKQVFDVVYTGCEISKTSAGITIYLDELIFSEQCNFFVGIMKIYCYSHQMYRLHSLLR